MRILKDSVLDSDRTQSAEKSGEYLIGLKIKSNINQQQLSGRVPCPVSLNSFFNIIWHTLGTLRRNKKVTGEGDNFNLLKL